MFSFICSLFQVVEQESRLPLDLTRDSSKLAGREVRLVQNRQEDDLEQVDKDKVDKVDKGKVRQEVNLEDREVRSTGLTDQKREESRSLSAAEKSDSGQWGKVI